MVSFNVLYAASWQFEALLYRHSASNAISRARVVHREASGALDQIPVEQGDPVKHPWSMLTAQ